MPDMKLSPKAAFSSVPSEGSNTQRCPETAQTPAAPRGTWEATTFRGKLSALQHKRDSWLGNKAGI